MASIRVQAQKVGSKLSGMVVPNLGAFMAWGMLTAIGIALNNDLLREFIGPMLNYLLPLLIAFAGGRAVYGYRGGVIGTVATMGAIVGADITMFLGAMILGPLAAWVLKKFDEVIDGKIPTGFELLINNFSVGIIGAIISIIGAIAVAPALTELTNVMSVGVDWMIQHKVLPFTAIFIEPAKILFLNNAIGQGILSPLGSTQLAEYGKSVLYLLESNPGPGLGVLLGYMVAGKGNSKASAFGASVIHLFGGIHEIYFPFVLMNPALLVALIAGGITGTFMFTLFNVGLVGVASPGSIITIMIMGAGGDHIKILIAVLASAAVSFLVSLPLVKRSKNDDDEFSSAAKEMENLKGKKSSISSVFESSSQTIDFKNMKLIAYACDAGMGSSAMGASILQKKINQAGIDDVKVFHISIAELPTECDLIVTQEALKDRVNDKQPKTQCIGITDFLNAPEYQEIVSSLMEAKILLEDNPMSSLVIMDFDGVIIDTEYVWYQIFVEWFKKNFDYTLSEEEFMMSIGADAHILFNYLREEKSIDVDLAAFKKETQGLFIEKSKNLPLIDGVESFIKQVKNDGWKLSLATSATKEKPLYHLKRLNLLNYFDYLVTADLVENIKPEPDLFLKAIDLAGVDKNDAVIIEDSKNGLIAGIRAGIDVIICPNRLTKDDDFTGCLDVVDSLDKIEL